MEHSYENLLNQGINLNTLMMCNEFKRDYFKRLNERYPNVEIDTIGNSIYHLYNNIKRFPDKFCLQKYDLFVLASFLPIDQMAYTDLDNICKECSLEKRVTFGYVYNCEKGDEELYYQYIIKSYINGKSDFTDIQYIDFNTNMEERTFLNIVANTHMSMVLNQRDVKKL